MKKRTLSILAFSAVFAFATLTSCGGAEEKQVEETATEEVTEEAHEELTEEVVEEAATEEMATEETSAGNAEAGAELFTSNGCVACHQLDAKTVGPSIKAIAEGYADNEAGMTAFLSGEGEAIIDPAMAAVMAPQVETTKNMSEEDRGSIVAYIMNNK